MKRIFCSIALLAGTMAFGQMGPAQPQPGQPPQGTPPTFPDDRKSPGQQMPPDQRAPMPESTSAAQVEQQITQEFNNEPTLASTNLRVEVDEASVLVSGIVQNAEQHEMALRIANSHSGDRNVVDKIRVKQQS